MAGSPCWHPCQAVSSQVGSAWRDAAAVGGQEKVSGGHGFQLEAGVLWGRPNGPLELAWEVARVDSNRSQAARPLAWSHWVGGTEPVPRHSRPHRAWPHPPSSPSTMGMGVTRLEAGDATTPWPRALGPNPGGRCSPTHGPPSPGRAENWLPLGSLGTGEQPSLAGGGGEAVTWALTLQGPSWPCLHPLSGSHSLRFSFFCLSLFVPISRGLPNPVPPSPPLRPFPASAPSLGAPLTLGHIPASSPALQPLPGASCLLGCQSRGSGLGPRLEVGSGWEPGRAPPTPLECGRSGARETAGCHRGHTPHTEDAAHTQPCGRASKTNGCRPTRGLHSHPTPRPARPGQPSTGHAFMVRLVCQAPRYTKLPTRHTP